jgi:SGNH hydrolase-like domain, acetyltransferase AlgX
MMIRWLINFAQRCNSIWIRRLGIAFAALLLLGIAGDILLRVVPGFAPAGPDSSEIAQQIKSQSMLGRMVYAPHSELGALIAPSLDHAIETLDFTYNLRTDHAGFPNAEPWPDHVDVAVLGDSLLVGPGVGIEGQFTTLLQQRLNGRTVLNFGLPGAGTEHAYLAYRTYVEPLRPELVIAVVCVAWDIDNSVHFARWRTELPESDFTEYRLSYGETHPTRWETIKRRLARSPLLRVGYGSIKPLFNGTPLLEQITFANGETIFLSARAQRRLAQGMDRPGVPNLHDIFFRPLDELRTAVGAAGAQFMVALLPSKEELYGAEAFPAVLRPFEDVKAELEARQFPILDLYPAVRAAGREKSPYYRADIHLNELGNRIVADAIAGWIEDEKILPPASAPPASVTPGIAVSGAN